VKIAVFGAGGRVGRRIAGEASARGHDVVAVSRGEVELPGASRLIDADILDTAAVTQLAADRDAVVSAVSSGFGQGTPNFSIYVAAARSVTEAVRSLPERQPRVLIVGGAGSLLIPDGVRVMDTPEFPEMFKPEALAHADGLAYWRTVNDVDWTYVSPPAIFEPGERTGRYRRGGDELLTDQEGRSYISMEDYAIGFVDELETPTALRQRITFAY